MTYGTELRSYTESFEYEQDTQQYSGWDVMIRHNLGTERISVTLWDENGHHVLPVDMQTQDDNYVSIEVGSRVERARRGLPEVEPGIRIEATVIG